MSGEIVTPPTESPTAGKRRWGLLALVALLLFELVGWTALRYQVDRQLGFGIHFWGTVILATGTCLILWLSVRALFHRRGWFTLKEFLVFMLLVGTLCGIAGKLYRKTLQQRQIAEYLSLKGARVTWGGADQPGFERWLGHEYFHGIESVDLIFAEWSEDDMALLARLPDLRWLQVGGQSVSDAHLRQLSEIRSLKQLTLISSTFTGSGLAHLRGHPALESLSLSGKQLNDDELVHLKHLPHLKYLTLGSSPASDAAMTHVGQCGNLESLYIVRGGLTDAGLQPLAGLPRLSALYINFMPITDDGLVHVAQIKNLRVLDLSGTKVSDAGLEYIRQLDQLRSLGLVATLVTKEAAERLERDRPHVQVNR